jgi:hypothetical protein
MTVSVNGMTETKVLDVLLIDNWVDVKEAACDLFDIDPKDYVIEFHCKPSETKLLRKNLVPAQVGQLDFGDGMLVLSKKSTDNEDSDSSSDSDSFGEEMEFNLMLRNPRSYWTMFNFIIFSVMAFVATLASIRLRCGFLRSWNWEVLFYFLQLL